MAPRGHGDGYGPDDAFEPTDPHGYPGAYRPGSYPQRSHQPGRYQRGAYGQAAHGSGPYGPYAPSDAETTLPLPVIEEGREGRPRRRKRRRFLYRATLTIASLVACLLIGFGLLLAFTPSAGQATQIAARLARQHGIAYPGPQVPANFERPLVATEDHRFYSEVGGIDPLALIRTAKGAITGGPDQGGATLEMQLAKLLYVGDNSPRNNTLTGKLTEVALAVKLDAMFSKAQILRLYAEVAYYGHGYYGLQQASCGYFGRPPADLTVTQGAMLAGAVNAPTLDDPIKNPAAAHARLAHVIGRMVAVGDLTPAQGQAALNEPLGLTSGHSPTC